MERKKMSGKTGATALFWVVIAVVFLLKAAGGLRSLDLDGFVLAVTVVSVAVPCVIFALVMGITLARRRRQKRSPRPAQPVRRADRPLPTAPQRTFSPTVYDGNLREDSAARDRERRLRQLEDFYKNGIVGKEEYQKLRAHYENS